jgi:hypothetical protein
MVIMPVKPYLVIPAGLRHRCGPRPVTGEPGEAVREAAYTYQPDTRIDAVAGPR